MNPTRYVRAALWATVQLLWCGAAMAAAVTLPGARELHALDAWLIVYSSIISTLSGGTALAWRINKLLLEYDESGKKFVRPWLFAIAHMSGSWLAGTLAFLYGSGQTWDLQYMLFAVLIMSFGGAAGVEKAFEKVFANLTLAPPGPPPGAAT